MVSNKTLMWIIGICFLVMVVSIVAIQIYRYHEAKENCSELKIEKDCSYEICMAAEFSSNNMMDKAEACIMKQIYKYAILGADE